MMASPRRPNSADNNPDRPDPLADNMRFGRRRPPGGTEPLESDRSVYDQQTVIDPNFSNRSQTRRLRQGGGSFSPQGVTAWAADPKNSRTLIIAAGVVVSLLLLFVLFRLYNGSGSNTAADDTTGTGAAASLPALGFESVSPAASADTGVGTVPQPVETVPSTDPAAQPPAGGTGQFFIVTGTGAEGLFLRPEPNTNQPPIGTLPEGTRIEFTGESQNDGTREWRKVKADLGQGWVAADFLQPAP